MKTTVFDGINTSSILTTTPSADPRRGTDTLDGGDTTKTVQPVWSDGSQGLPGAFKFIDFREQLQEIGGNLDGVYCKACPILCRITGTLPSPSLPLAIDRIRGVLGRRIRAA